MAIDVDRGSLDDEMTALFAGQRARDPFSVFDRLREEAPPVTRFRDSVCVTDLELIRQTLSDRVHYGALAYIAPAQARKMTASWSEENRRLFFEEMEEYKGKIATLTGDDHERVRSIAMRFFTPRQIKKLEDFARTQWAEILDGAEQEAVYDHRAAAQDYALRIVAEIADTPAIDRPYIAKLMNTFSPAPLVHDEHAWRESFEAGADLRRYIDEEVIGGYRRNPSTSEFVATMMGAEGEENLSHAEMRSMVDSVFVAGLETTATFLTSLFLELLRHREQWEILCSDPSLVPNAVEELFRFVTPVNIIPRIAAEDFEFEDVEIAAGQSVFNCVAAAHRDPRYFDRPTELDVTRPKAQHLGLGYGHRYCIGASLVRMDIRVALEMLVRRYPEAELAVDPDELEWTGNMTIRTVTELPVKLGPRH